jgi:IS4 transposase
VDRLFRTHGPEDLVEVYRRRPAVEALFAFVKTQFGFTVNRVRGLAQVSIHVSLSLISMLAVALSAVRLGRPGLVRCIKGFVE